MTDIVQIIEGRIDRKKNNALTITFADGPRDPLGTSVQGGGDQQPTLLTRPDGAAVADLDLVRTLAGWSLGRDLVDATIWWGRAGRPLPIPFLGTSVKVFTPLTAVEHEQLIASCIDIAVGLRPYGTAMRR